MQTLSQCPAEYTCFKCKKEGDHWIMDCPLTHNNLFSFLWKNSFNLKLNVLQINPFFNRIKENIHHTNFTKMHESELQNGLNKSGLESTIVSRFINVLTTTVQQQTAVDTTSNQSKQTCTIPKEISVINANDTVKLQTRGCQEQPQQALEHQLRL